MNHRLKILCVLLLVALTPGSGFGNITKVSAPSASIGGTLTSGTAGSVLFVGPGPVFAQDNASLFFDDTSNYLGIGTTSPVAPLSVAREYFNTTAGEQYGQFNSVYYEIADTGRKHGQRNQTYMFNASGVLADVAGMSSTLSKLGNGNVTSAMGYHARVDNNTAAAVVTNAYGLFIESGLRTGVVTNDFGVYQQDTTAKNFFGGKVGIGSTTAPQNLLEVSQLAGTTPGTVGSYGIKLSNGGTSAIAFGANGAHNLIQSYSRPLKINDQGQNTLINPSSGFVGIGSASPTEILDVVGSAKVTDAGGNGGNVPHERVRRSNTSNASATCAVTCSAGETATGGGCDNTLALNLARSYPSADATWSCEYTLATGDCTAWAVCFDY